MAGNLRKLRHQTGDYTILPMQCGWNPTSVYQGFVFFFPLLKLLLTLFQDLTSLRGGLKTASGKESLSSSHKRCSGQGTPRCHPKAGDATFWSALRLQRWLSLRPLQPCLWQIENLISYTSFMVSMAQEWRSPLASSAPVLPSGRIDLDSKDDQ
jgi:hypothetical protein